MPSWKASIKKALMPPLPGAAAHAMMAPRPNQALGSRHNKEDGVQSSVLILLYPTREGIKIPFIQRPVYQGYHSGQISLPGGKNEDYDGNDWEAALRETREELGIDTEAVEYLGQLTRIYIDRSNYFVNPQVGYIAAMPAFKPDVKEVAEVIEVKLIDLAIQSKMTEQMQHPSGISVEVPYYDAGGKHIWGATAMIISELIETLNERLPDWVSALHSYNAHISRGSL
ncbi:MAG TPA: coenzyme A pyrophosphatase [Marinilabiliaceae bacterium]|nr:coenzyme A pyrophosphatase [Marinilabiliaceae bacterium]HBX87088.1 coenzyme A pyrophosphatase [Marinilabiliaceae bacterium]